MDPKPVFRLGEYILKVPYFLGLPSVRFNKTIQLFEPISYLPDKLRCLFISLVMCVLKCSVIVSLIENQSHLNLARFEDCVQIVMVSLCLLSLGCDLHFWRKFDYNLRLLNVQRVTINVLCKRYGRTDIPPRKSKAEIALKFCVTAFMAIVLVGPILCIGDTNMYILLRLVPTPVLPTCAPIVDKFTCTFVPSLDLQTIVWIGFMMTTQFVFFLYLAASFWFHSVLIISVALLGTEILEAVSADNDEESWAIPAALKPPVSNGIYAVAQIIVNIVNESVLHDLYPFMVVYFICFLVFSLSVLIKVNVPFALKLIGVITQCITGLYLYCLVVIPSLFTVYSVKFLNKLKLQCRSRKEVLSKVHQACRPLRIGIGGFATLDESTIMVLIHIIILRTVDYILTVFI